MKITGKNTLLFGLLAFQLITPNFGASEVEQETNLPTEEKIKVSNVKAAELTDIVTFGDAEFATYIGGVLEVDADAITVEDMSRLINVNYQSKNLSDLTGLEYAVNLTNLNLKNNNVSDLSPIRDLENLKTISLESNNVSDLSPIRNLTNLLSFEAANNNISDLTPIINLTNLAYLKLDMNNISDLTPIANLTKLETLMVGANNISNITALSNLTELKYVYLLSNNIDNIAPLANLTNISTLNINNCNISDLTPLENLTNVKILFATNNKITDISALAKLTELTSLMLSNNEIEDIAAIENLTNVNNLQLDANKISDISPVTNLPRVEYLALMENNISDVSPLSKILTEIPNSWANVTNQVVTLEEKTVNNNAENIYNLTRLDGTEVPVSLGVPAIGENNMTATKSYTIAPNSNYSATINQKVTYREITSLDTANTNEGTVLTDQQLITLFNVVSIENNPLVVDQSAVDYNQPGDYRVTFEDGIDTINVTLTVNDLLPLITVENDTVTIKLGDTIADYLMDFGVTATELQAGDLTNSIVIDDSAVDYTKAGNYTVTFTVTDEEGNEDTKTGNVIIEEVIVVIEEEIKSEEKSEEKSEVQIETTQKSEVTVESEQEVVESEKTTKAMSKTENQVLTETGNQASIYILTLTLLVGSLVTLKRVTVKQN